MNRISQRNDAAPAGPMDAAGDFRARPMRPVRGEGSRWRGMFSGHALALALLCSGVAQAATYTVTRLDGNADQFGTCTTTNCRLRDAVAKANASAEDDLIVFAPGLAGTIPLNTVSPLSLFILGHASNNTGALVIDGDSDGDGQGDIVLSGGNTIGTVRVLGQHGATLRNLTVSGGRQLSTNGGGITNNGLLTLENVVVSGNQSVGTDGGGIGNSGTLRLDRSTVSGNTSSRDGGGIANASNAMLTLDASSVSGNTATGRGGGLYNFSGEVVLIDSSVSGGNQASEGGGLYNSDFFGHASISLLRSTVAGNHASQNGGGIHNGDADPDFQNAALSLVQSTVSGNAADNDGGGLYLTGSIATLGDSAVSGNTANRNGGGIYVADGGALALERSTVSGNAAGTGTGTDNDGGGLHVRGAAVLNQSTVSDNSAGHWGGGVFALSSDPETALASVVLNHSTISHNSNHGLHVRYANATLNASVVAASASATVDCAAFESSFTASHNLIGRTATCAIVHGVDGNLVGTTAVPVDALLDALADNGGPTLTHMPQTGSPLLDTVACDLIPDFDNSADQRGVARGVGANCDIGSVERGGLMQVNTTADESNTDSANGFCALREALGNANGNYAGNGDCAPGLGNDTIRFDPAVFADEATATITLASQELAISNAGSLSIDGRRGDGGRVTLSGNDALRVLRVNSGSVATLSNLNLIRGHAIYGGAIFNQGNLTLTHCVLSDNVSMSSGGAISSVGTLLVSHCTLTRNQAVDGGAIHSDEPLTVEYSTLSDNNASEEGGGVYNSWDGALKVRHSTVSGNVAGSGGGGIYSVGHAQIDHVTLAGNGGGGLRIDGAATTLRASVVADNSGMPDCAKGVSGNVSAGFNLIEDAGNCGIANGANGNIVGVDPLLGALTDHGGDTHTRMAQHASPLLDAVACNLIAGFDNSTDQRGIARPQGATCDLGAVEARRFALSVAVSGQGEVASTPVGIAACTDACAADFVEATPVQLSATPASGWHFVEWGGDCASDGMVTLDAAKSCAAAFAINTYEVAASAPGGGGGITPALQSIAHGSTAGFTVAPDADYHLESVSGDTCTPMDDGDGLWIAENIVAACDVIAVFAADEADPPPAPLCFVDAGVAAPGDGRSWANAYASPQDALADVACEEIWVAEGVYRPVGPLDPGDITGTHRAISFVIDRTLRLYGGFAGDETELAQRDLAAHRAILSGDIGGDDNDTNGIVLHHGDIVGGNSQAVLRVLGPIGADAVIDGFIVTAGLRAGGSGGGLICNGSGAGNTCNPTLANLVFSGNHATTCGGAIYNDGRNGGEASPTLRDVYFSGNFAIEAGGAMCNDAENGFSRPRIERATFQGNESALNGGALFNNGDGGPASPVLNNVTFADNTAGGNGGAVHNRSANGGTARVILNHVTFSGNEADNRGGAISNNGTGTQSLLTNSILWGNNAGSGGNEIYYSGGAGADIGHSIVQGACAGILDTDPEVECVDEDLIDADPKLAAPADHGGFAPVMLPGPSSAAVDAGADQCPVQADPLELAACPDHDQRGQSRPRGPGFDLGAVEVDSVALQVSVTGAGQIDAASPLPFGVAAIAGCTASAKHCVASYAPDALVTLLATPALGWHVEDWGGACGAFGNATEAAVMMDADKSCTTSFAISQYTVFFEEQGGSAVADASGDFGTPVTLAAAPLRAGYAFAGWNTAADGSGMNHDAGASFVLPANDVTLYAQWLIVVTASAPGGHGQVTPAAQAVGSGDSATFDLFPDTDYAVARVEGDTCTPQDNGNGTWTANGIAKPCAVEAVFLPGIDVAVLIDNHQSTLSVGTTTIYDITVGNFGKVAVSGLGLDVEIAPADGLIEPAWACVEPEPGVACDPKTGENAPSLSLDLPANGLARIELSALVGEFTGLLNVTARLAVPDGYVDAELADNTATDSDVRTDVFQDGFEEGADL